MNNNKRLNVTGFSYLGQAILLGVLIQLTLPLLLSLPHLLPFPQLPRMPAGIFILFLKEAGCVGVGGGACSCTIERSRRFLRSLEILCLRLVWRGRSHNFTLHLGSFYSFEVVLQLETLHTKDVEVGGVCGLGSGYCIMLHI